MKLSLEQLVVLGSDGLTRAELEAEGSKIAGFLKGFEARGQGFPLLPKARGPVLAVKELAEKLRGKFKDIVVLGIGGSALGINCVRDALMGPLWNFHSKTRLFVLDNLDTVGELERVIDADQTLFIVISKSGTTPETMAQYFYFKQKVSKENFVFITDGERGELREIGKEYGIPMLTIPENVGGRFSVLTPVGLFPAAMMGVDIEELLRGAEGMANLFMKEEWELNVPFQFAAAQYLLEWKYGVHITVVMPYSSRLSSLADWYGQLLAESIGKDGKGLTPVSSLGVTDQHSQLQLYNEGPKDKLIVFVEVEREQTGTLASGECPTIPKVERKSLAYLSGLTFHGLMNVEKRGTEQALSEYKKPNVTISVPEVNAYELGQLFMFFEASIAFLGEYYRINAFDQPGVELSKQLTKQLLSR